MASALEKMRGYEKYSDEHRPATRDTGEMLLGCGASASKKILFSMNLTFLFLGAVVIGIGAYYVNQDSAKITTQKLAQACIVLGCCVLLLSFLGCCGAHFENSFFLMIYSGLLIILILTQVIIAAIILADKSKADNLVRNGWNDASEPTRCDVQRDFECCSLEPGSTTTPVCPPEILPCDSTPDRGGQPYCMNKIKAQLDDNLSLLGGIAIAFALFEIFGVAFSMYLRSALKKERDAEKNKV